MNWQPYPQTKPPKAGIYLIWESFNGEGAAELLYYTKRDGFTDENGIADDWITHWCEVTAPTPGVAR